MPLYSMWNRKHVFNRAFQMANNKACGGGTTKRPASYSFWIDPTENVEHHLVWSGNFWSQPSQFYSCVIQWSCNNTPRRINVRTVSIHVHELTSRTDTCPVPVSHSNSCCVVRTFTAKKVDTWVRKAEMWTIFPCRACIASHKIFLYVPLYQLETFSNYYLSISNIFRYSGDVLWAMANCFIYSFNWVFFHVDPVDVLLRNCQWLWFPKVCDNNCLVMLIIGYVICIQLVRFYPWKRISFFCPVNFPVVVINGKVCVNR